MQQHKSRINHLPKLVLLFAAVLAAPAFAYADDTKDGLLKALAGLASDDGDQVEAAVAELTKFNGAELLGPLQALQDD